MGLSPKTRKPVSYWVITILMWLILGGVTYAVIDAFLAGEIVEFIFGLVLLTIMVLEVHPPMWYRRFAQWVREARGI